MAHFWPPKDPSEVLDYTIQWDPRLAGDQVTGSTFQVVNGTVTINSSTFSTNSTTVWLQGGTLMETCDILNTITTLGGRTMDQNVQLKIRTRN